MTAVVVISGPGRGRFGIVDGPVLDINPKRKGYVLVYFDRPWPHDARHIKIERLRPATDLEVQIGRVLYKEGDLR